ncbi:MAG: polysaccharide biosynthesis protein [Oxalobacteraceae bacterium]|nr:MAG: polysaccharide biosynthesis protein [Oxalobacteraceae bacterium]
MIQATKSAGGEQEGLSRLAAIVWQYRTTLLTCMALSVALATLGYVRSPKRYSAEAVLALDARKLQALPNESVMSPLPQESPVLRTELDIIGSRSMAERVHRRLQIAEPSTGPDVRQDRAVAVEIPDETKKSVDDLLHNVRVVNDGRSYTIYISYYAGDPVFAATVANAFAQAYIDYQIDLQTTATRRVSDWLGERLVSLQIKLEESERAAAEFREKAGLVDAAGGEANLRTQQLSALNVELTSLDARLFGAKARLSTAIEAVNAEAGLGLTEVLSSPAVQLLRAEHARVIRALADINRSGASMNPQRPQLESQLASLKNQITQEISQIVASLRNEIEVAERQQAETARRLVDVQQAISSTGVANVQAGQLEREASANRSIYETYLTRYKQTIEQDGIATAEARIITRAMPGIRPTSPDIGLWGLVALLLGTSTGVTGALLRNLGNRRIGSISALQQKTSLPVIGRIPRAHPLEITAGPGMFGGKAAGFYGAIAELQAYIRLSEEKARVIAFTSSSVREGKTFVVTNLARSLAANGLRVLAIDANLRDPALASAFSIQASCHLASAVAGDISFDDLLQRDPFSAVDVIIARLEDTPADFILGSRRFAALMAEMKQRYDIVLIDSPSVFHELDLMRIATMADAVTFVLRPDVSDGARLECAIDKLRRSGSHVLGIVLNGVHSDKHRRFRWPALGLRGLDRSVAGKPQTKARPTVLARD